jgi:RNA recognition motif-containing protein
MMVKLFVGGFPLEITELELVQWISPYGTVVTIKIVRDKKTRICKGYAFLEMESRQDAEQAMEALDGTTFLGREMRVNIVEEQPEPVKPVYRKVERSGPGGFVKAKRPRKI